MRIVCISDTHSRHERIKLPPGDMLVHAGDATMSGRRTEMLNFLNWFSKQQYRYKIYVPGNHDFFAETNYSTTQILCVERGIIFLVDKARVIEDVKFYGTPWVPNLQMWAYYGNHETLIRRFDAIPADTEVLITHTPPFGILARGGNHHWGSEELARRLHELNVKLHIFGHIHDSYGVEDHQAGRWSVNAAICNEKYDPDNEPLVFVRDDEGVWSWDTPAWARGDNNEQTSTAS